MLSKIKPVYDPRKKSLLFNTRVPINTSEVDYIVTFKSKRDSNVPKVAYIDLRMLGKLKSKIDPKEFIVKLEEYLDVFHNAHRENIVSIHSKRGLPIFL